MEEVKRYTIDFSDDETAEGVLYTDYAALKSRVAELTQLHADACFDRNLAQTERDSLRAQLEAAKVETPWGAGKQALALAALEWERLRRGMPGSTPETISKAETAFWTEAAKLQAIKVSMIRKSIEDARAASPDGKTSWDRVEDYRIEHGHLPRQDRQKEPGCEACKKEKP